MNKMTQQAFDALPIVDGYKQCPVADYYLIDSFGERCSFGDGCRFGGGCSFGEWCSFGDGCRFGGGCSFGDGCRFGGGCSFGERCSFGDGCRFEEDVALPGFPFIALDGAGSRDAKTYFFNLKNGIQVRCGCFVGNIEKFKEEVVKTHGNSVHAQIYLRFAEIAELKFNREQEKQP